MLLSVYLDDGSRVRVNVQHFNETSHVHSMQLLPTYVEGNHPPTTEGLFRWDELIGKILGLAEDPTPIALPSAGGREDVHCSSHPPPQLGAPAMTIG